MQNEEFLEEIKKFMGINAVLTVFLCVIFLFSGYLMLSKLLDEKINKPQSEATTQFQDETGINFELGEFVVNLLDAHGRYLKANVTLEFAKKTEDKSGDNIRLQDSLRKELATNEAAIKDAVITVLSAKTSGELATKAGKELAKEEIAQKVDETLGGKREVMRVNFSQFVIQ